MSEGIQPGDLLWGQVTKSKYNEDCGVVVSERNGKLWVTDIRPTGLFKQQVVPLEAGDQLLMVNDRSVDNGRMTLEAIQKIFREEKHVKVQACRAQYGLYESSSNGCSVNGTDHSEGAPGEDSF